VPFLR
jgi:hypothetical protein